MKKVNTCFAPISYFCPVCTLQEKINNVFIYKNPLAHQELGNNVKMKNESIVVLPFYPISAQCAPFPFKRKNKDAFVYKNLMNYHKLGQSAIIKNG